MNKVYHMVNLGLRLFFAFFWLSASIYAAEELSVSEKILNSQRWQDVKLSLVESVIAILALNEDAEVYFLDRDARLVFYAAKEVALKLNRKDLANKLHLISVSRLSANDPMLLDYLRQEGVSETEFQKGKKFIFVDIGFLGSIVDLFKYKFQSYIAQIYGILLYSDSDNYPHLRVFGIPSQRWGTSSSAPVYYLAKLPKSKGSIIGYERRDGKIIPVFDLNGDLDDGMIDPDAADKLKLDLKTFIENHSLALVEERWELWSFAIRAYKKGMVGELFEFLKSKQFYGGKFGRAFVNDFLEQTNFNLINPKIFIHPSQILAGLTELNRVSSLRSFSILGRKFKSMAIAPYQTTLDLVEQRDFKTLDRILLIVLSDEVIRYFFKKALNYLNVPISSFVAASRLSIKKSLLPILFPRELVYILKGIVQALIEVEATVNDPSLYNLIQRILRATHTQSLSETLEFISKPLNPFNCGSALKQLP